MVSNEDRKDRPTNNSEDESSLGRRTFVKMAGVATAGAILSSTAQTAAADTALPNAILLDGTGTSGETTYEFSASETVERVYENKSVDDEVAGATVTGSLADEMTAYGYSGSITDLSLDGPASVRVGSDLELPEPRTEFVVRSDSEITYEFTADGEVTKLLDNGRNSSEDNDSVAQNDDGTWTVSGYTGNGYGDGFAVRGDITEFSPLEGPFELFVDGQSTSVTDLTGQEPVSTNDIAISADGEVSYEFTTSGAVEKNTDNGRNSSEDNDTVTQNDDGTWTVSGYTGNGYGDSYTFEGEVQSYSPQNTDHTIVLNGEETDPWSLVGEEKPQQDSTQGDSTQLSENVIGGGDAYAGKKYSESGAQFVARNYSELEDAMSRASRGDVVFVPGTEQIQLRSGSGYLKVPDGVTLASDRGVDGSGGALLYETNEDPARVIRVGNDTEIAGLRLRGPHAGRDHLWASGDGIGESSNATGVWMDGQNNEVHNAEIFGFGYNGIYASDSGTHVHHCEIRECNRWGYGYGISCSPSSSVTAEYNYFDRNRHCIAAHGSASYTARYNVIAPDQVHHAFDHHGEAGKTEIHNNRFEQTPDTVPIKASAFRARECIDGPISIHHNWCYNTNEPDPNNPGDDDAAFANGGCDFKNMNISDNHYGTSSPPSGCGLDL